VADLPDRAVPPPEQPTSEAGRALVTNAMRIGLIDVRKQVVAIEAEARAAERRAVARIVESFRYSRPLSPGNPEHRMWERNEETIRAILDAVATDTPEEPDRAVQPEAPTGCGCQCHGPYQWDVCPHCRPDLLGKPTPTDVDDLVQQIAVGIDGEPYTDRAGGDRAHAALKALARAASQERPQPKTWRQPMADEPGGRRNPSYEIECGECGTRLRITNNYSPQGDFLDQSSEPVGVAQERPQPHDGCGCESCMCPDPSAHAGAQERPSIDVLAAFFHEEYWSETGDTHLPREQAESTDCEICWHSAAKLHGLLSSPEPVEPGE
jgi:hypothetical protein